MARVALTRSDWSEIYYALDSKEKAIKAGKYGPEDVKGQDTKWRRHLKSIMAKIRRRYPDV